jgi:predicted MFS family arabinose efflux permease
VIALAADLTRDEVRTKAMAVIGMTIGGTFAVSLVLGPLATNWIGVPGIFAATGVLAIAAIGVLTHLVPDVAAREAAPSESNLAAFRRVLADPQLLRLNYGIFALHAVLMALFVQIPFELRDAGLAAGEHWRVYLPVLAASVVLMLPLLRHADRPERGKRVFVGAVFLLAVSEIVLAFAGARFAWLVAGLVAFFTAFNLLEAALPSLVSKFAPPAMRGTAVGVYSSVQFLGTFVGAAAGGIIAQFGGAAGVFAFGVALTAAWLVASASMQPPPAAAQPSMGDS